MKMANMSYCRFQNTASDLLDCVNTMQDEETLQDLDLSEEELRAMVRMVKLCGRFVEEYERLQNAEVYEEEE